jgi:hemolysin III
VKAPNVRTTHEEIANAVSHAIGLGLAVAGISVLVVQSMSYEETTRMVGAIVYGATLILMYLSSTLYHGYQIQPHKHYFRVFDHSTIYFVISGTFTPFLISQSHSQSAWIMLAVIWSLCILGVLYKLFFFGRSELESVSTYVLVSWVAIMCVYPLLSTLPPEATHWLVAGLVVYTIGTYFYLNDQHPYFHTAWHLFVIGGSTCHYIGIMLYVIPVQPG